MIRGELMKEQYDQKKRRKNLTISKTNAEAGIGGVSAIVNGTQWYDQNGDVIQGHGGNILVYAERYYWVGEYKNTANFSGIALYSSEDLMNWTFENMILTPETATSEGDTIGFCTIERPKLIYNALTDMFVLWAHWENGNDYSESKLLVAECDRIGGDYTYLRRFNPAGNRSLDFTVFVEEEKNQAYIISAGGSNGHTMFVYPLTEDYRDVDSKNSYAIFADAGREAPALVKVNDYYLLLTSGQSGWYPNQCQYAYTKDISTAEGWSDLQVIGNNSTYYSQPTNIAIIKDKQGKEQYLYMGDRWNPGDLGRSTYVWLPLNIETNDTGITSTMNYVGEWFFHAATGAVDFSPLKLVSVGKTASASIEAEDHPAGMAVDGINYTDDTWCNSNFYSPDNTVPFTWQVDLGEVYELKRLDLSTRICNGSETYYQYTIDGSIDGINWNVIVDESDNNVVAFRSNQLDGAYRYVRISCSRVINVHNGNTAEWAAGIVEVEVYA